MVNTYNGVSEASVTKQKLLRRILKIHTAHRSNKSTYSFIDMNAGVGHHKQFNIYGSPLIFLDVAASINLDHSAYFFEKEESYFDQLTRNTRMLQRQHPDVKLNYKVILGDHGHNRDVLSHVKGPGLIYCDPYGCGVPAEIVAGMLDHDVLLTFSERGYKRAQLDLDAVKRICDKRHWIVSGSWGTAKWRFLYGTNLYDSHAAALANDGFSTYVPAECSRQRSLRSVFAA